MLSFKNQTVLVTGATKGIGHKIASSFYNNGACVIITGTNKSKINQINSKGDERLIALEANFLDEGFIEKLAEDLKPFKKIDVLINNAGINKINDFVISENQDFKNINNVNLYAPYLVSKLVIKKMLNNDYGKVINISSIFGKLSKPKRALYSMSKFGLHGLTVALSAELSKKNILCNTVSPGFVETDLTKKILSKKEIKNLEGIIPLGRLAQPEEITGIVSFLSSKENTYISGQNIFVDGGFTIV